MKTLSNLKIGISGIVSCVSMLMLLTVFAVSAYAVPAYPYPLPVKQPDGTDLTIRIHGNRSFHYTTTEDGYVIFKNENDYFVYAERDNDGELVPGTVIARNAEQRTSKDKKFLKAYKPYEAFSEKTMSKVPKHHGCDLAEDLEDQGAHKVYPSNGSPRSLVILVNYQDVKFVVPEPQKAFTRLLNEPGYTGDHTLGTDGYIGSARDYFIESSNGKFSPVFDVFGPYLLPREQAYYGNNPREMIKDACNAAYGEGVNFANYDFDDDGIVDNVFVYYAGNNSAESPVQTAVWPQRWNLGNYKTNYNGKSVFDFACTSEMRFNYKTPDGMCGIGAFCHEFSHVIGLTDLYNTQASSEDVLTPAAGMNDIMARGNYAKTGDGKIPPSYSAWHRFFVGWGTPKQLNMPTTDLRFGPLNADGDFYFITNGDFNMSNRTPDPSRIFILENRQPIGFDQGLFGHGMLLWEINYKQSHWFANAVNTQANGENIKLILADGKKQEDLDSLGYAGDFFPGATNKTSYTMADKYGELTSIREDGRDLVLDFNKNKQYLNISKMSMELDIKKNSTDSFFIESDTAWYISQNAAGKKMFTVSPTTGSGNAIIRVTALDSGTLIPLRVDTLTIMGDKGAKNLVQEKKFAIKQSPTPLVRSGWVSNIDTAQDTAFHKRIIGTGEWGFIAGHNSYLILEMAERFTNTGEYILDSIRFWPYRMDASDSTSKIVFRVYAEESGVPGRVLGEQSILMKDYPLITDTTLPDRYHRIAFKNSVVVDGNFYVGALIDYDKNPMDTFAFVFADNAKRTPGNTTAFLRYRFYWTKNNDFYSIGNIGYALEAHINPVGSGFLPTVILADPTHVTDSTIILNADLTRIGSDLLVEKGFEVSASSDFSSAVAYPVSGLTTGAYEYELKGLTAGDMLYYRAYVKTTAATTMSQDVRSFVVGIVPDYLTLTPSTVHLSSKTGSYAQVDVLTNLPWTSSYNENSFYSIDTTNGDVSLPLIVTAISDNTSATDSRVDTVTFTAGGLASKLVVVQDPKPIVVLPTVSATSYKRPVGRNCAVVTVNVSDQGKGTVLERGIYWTTSSKWDGTSTKVKATTNGIGACDVEVDSLPVNTYIYTKGYAVNEAGEALDYGNGQSFSTSNEPLYLDVKRALVVVPDTSAGVAVIKVSSSVLWHISVDSMQPWFSIDKLEKNISGRPTEDSLKIHILSANTSTEPRHAEITLSGSGLTRIINLYQNGTVPSTDFEVEPKSIYFASLRDSVASINVMTESAWTLTCDAEWLKFNKTSGTGMTEVRVSAREANPTAPRTAVVHVTSGDVTKDVTVTQDIAVGIKPVVDQTVALKVVPNPVEDHFTVSTSATIKEVKMLNNMGQELDVRSTIKGTSVEVDASQLPTGAYLIHVKTNKGVGTEKVIKQ